MQIEYSSRERLGSGVALGLPYEAADAVTARVLQARDVTAAYGLRHEVFAKELRWVPQSDDGLEHDVYDAHAKHFGVFRDRKMLSCLRLVSPEHRYMLEKEFRSLVSPDHDIRKAPDTREVSRLCVSFDERGTKVRTSIGVISVSMLLYRQVYQWCIPNKVRYLYLVVEYKVLRLLKMFGFPCVLVGEPTRMPDGVTAAAAIMDWREFEAKNLLARPELVDWFNQDQEFQGALPPRRPAAYSGRQVFL
ncbi:MAG: N-acyl-L-homoserine lactone synthetase [Solidesulfovibrio magneticus str. Maddingley MBC34]|uniref:N-acyl-L-homoserine lactone synthetase n=1 Tax=Solidesulfovibrio magneticus str. Maddingley MBC34 TaxID=1206767 RepID=K6GUW4_9BACT|nr:MAG: N-acyl-L-homoserine lactone synthetase [Solidesulfovibrio magneticus str. Maddingley MBC34]